jgi:hypothetical protein
MVRDGDGLLSTAGARMLQGNVCDDYSANHDMQNLTGNIASVVPLDYWDEEQGLNRTEFCSADAIGDGPRFLISLVHFARNNLAVDIARWSVVSLW